MDITSPDYKTPPVDLQAVIELAREINPHGSVVEMAVASQLLPLGNCYWNAAYVAEQRRGRVVYGWLFHHWPGCYVEAMHHAVVELPDGTLLDVTAKYPSVRNDRRSIFLPDQSIPVDLEKLGAVQSRHFVISRAEAVHVVIFAYRQMHSLEALASALYYEIGYRCNSQFDLAAGRQPDLSRKFPNNISAQMLGHVLEAKQCAVMRLVQAYDRLRRGINKGSLR